MQKNEGRVIWFDLHSQALTHNECLTEKKKGDNLCV